jgi:transposase
MPKPSRPPAKQQALRRQACLNPHPEQVRDELFQNNDFFDADDLVQVKYEMLRRVQKDGHTVSKASAAFGFSRPSFYQAQSAFQQEGLQGLVPHKRGPKHAHKLTQRVVELIQEKHQQDPSLPAPALANAIQAKFGIVVHPRSIERSLARTQKKRRQPS